MGHINGYINENVLKYVDLFSRVVAWRIKPHHKKESHQSVCKWERSGPENLNRPLSEKLLLIEQPYGQKHGAENGKEKKKENFQLSCIHPVPGYHFND